MKNWFWIPLAAIAGGIVGSWGPREDLELYKANVQEERTQKKVSGSTGFDAFAKLANIPDVARRRPKARTNELARTVKPVETNAVGLAQARKPGENYPVLNDNHKPPAVGMSLPKHGSREDLEARIEEAADLWNTRVELAKTQWKGRLGIEDGKDAEAFDSAVATMNESLRDTMEALAEEIEKAGKVSPELGLRMMGDLSRNLADAYDSIGALVPADRRGEVSEMPVHEFIDPMVAEPLISVQDKLEGGFRMRGGIR